MDDLPQAQTALPRVSARRYLIYIAIVVALPGLFLASSIPIVKSSSFLAESADPFLLNADYAFSLNHVNCDVVIFGDSTAVTGIDPSVVQALTNLKTCNIAQSQSIFEVVGTMALDSYLNNNLPPRYIIIQLSPETISSERNFFWPEGLTMLVRKRSIFASVAVMAMHPVQAYGFAMWAIKAKVASMKGVQPDFSRLQSIFRSTHGLVILPKPPETSCVRDFTVSAPQDETRVENLRRRYATSRTRVLVNVSPVPACTPNAAQISSAIGKLTDNVLPVYPIGLFCDLDRHLTMEGAARLSTDVARQLLSLSVTQ